MSSESLDDLNTNSTHSQKTRRPSLGRSASKLLKRASSLGRLVRQGSSRSVGGTDYDDTDHSDHTEHSRGGADHNELRALSRTIKDNVMKLKRCEAAIEKQVHTHLRLALSRFSDRSVENPTAAYAAMRKAHKNKTMLGHTIVARMQLVDQRQQVKNAIEHGNYTGLLAAKEKTRMKDILANLQYQQTQYTQLSDKEARSELKKRMMNEDLDSYL